MPILTVTLEVFGRQVFAFGAGVTPDDDDDEDEGGEVLFVGMPGEVAAVPEYAGR